MASVAVGISCTGPLGGKQGLWPYPTAPSQVSTQHLYSLGHTLKNNLSFFLCFFLDLHCAHYTKGGIKELGTGKKENVGSKSPRRDCCEIFI